MENVFFFFLEIHVLEMLKEIIDGPGLETPSMCFATNKYAKYQDLKERNGKKSGAGQRNEILITNVYRMKRFWLR